MSRFILWGFVIVGISATDTASGQPPAAFEVVSVKPAPPGSRTGVNSDDSQYVWENVTLEALIMQGYRGQAYRVTGPPWIQTARFNVSAKIPDGLSRRDVPEMLQTMLADRFGLRVHLEVRDVQAYALTIGNSPLRLTPTPENGWDNPPTPLVVRSMTLDFYSEALLTAALGIPVVNKTGLKGEYLLAVVPLATAASLRRVASRMAARSATDNDDPADPAASPVFSVVQNLGLKLELRKLPLSLMVVDHAEKTPTEN